MTVAKQRDRKQDNLEFRQGQIVWGLISNVGHPKHIRRTLTVVFKKTSTFVLSRKIT